MASTKKYKLAVAIVSKGRGSKIVQAAKEKGAQGGTIIQGHGTATRGTYETILGIAYEPEKDLVIIGVPETQLPVVLGAIAAEGKLNTPGKGVGFVLDLTKIHGVVHPEEVLDNGFTKEGPVVADGKSKFDLIVTIVNRGKAVEVVEASKEAGAEGGTIINGRGSGIHETAKVFGIPIEPEKDIVLTLIDSVKTDEVLAAISERADLKKAGQGIAFVLAVDKTVGICHLEE